jgi:DNA-binding NtrC family response regulator
MFELYGAEVLVADSSISVIQQMMFSSRIPNFILSDYRLIEENGINCINKIRSEFNEEIPAIIITGDTAPDDLNVLKKSGIEVLYKPISADSLLMTIANRLKNASLSA